MIVITARTIIIYAILTAGMRMMGKRQIGELRLSELVTTLLVSEVAVLPVSDANIPLLNALIPIAIIFALEILIPWAVSKSKTLKRLIDGTPSIIIRKGKISIPELTRMRITVEELIGELRLKNISDPSEVEYAILEQSGQLSVFPKDSARPPNASELAVKCSGKGIAHVLIADGAVSRSGIEQRGHDESWLRSKIKKDADFKDVFLFTEDDAGNIKIVYKDNKKKEKRL